MERGALLATMASKLPPGAISFSSRLKSITGQGPDGTLLELQDGRRLLSKVVLGCDGVNSPIARWMGFSEPGTWGTWRSAASQTTPAFSRSSPR